MRHAEEARGEAQAQEPVEEATAELAAFTGLTAGEAALLLQGAGGDLAAAATAHFLQQDVAGVSSPVVAAEDGQQVAQVQTETDAAEVLLPTRRGMRAPLVVASLHRSLLRAFRSASLCLVRLETGGHVEGRGRAGRRGEEMRDEMREEMVEEVVEEVEEEELEEVVEVEVIAGQGWEPSSWPEQVEEPAQARRGVRAPLVVVDLHRSVLRAFRSVSLCLARAERGEQSGRRDRVDQQERPTHQVQHAAEIGDQVLHAIVDDRRTSSAGVSLEVENAELRRREREMKALLEVMVASRRAPRNLMAATDPTPARRLRGSWTGGGRQSRSVGARSAAPCSNDEMLGGGSGECVICLDALTDLAFVPCGHMCCSACGERLAHLRLVNCPICRGPIERTLRLFG